MAKLSVEELVVKYGDVAAVRGISFEVQEGELVTLLGPSGCGKTTTLRCVAGLETATGGTISIGDTVVAAGRRHTPPEKRDINMVFQSYAVWPHLTVFENVAYGLRTRRRPKDEIARRVNDALRLVGLAELGPRYGTELSGGQQQRVAVARAIVTEPRLLLFDEPLSNLDAGLREHMRFELVELQKKIGKTAIYVTHDQAEAMVMSDRIILMNEGQIVQVGTPRELYRQPVSRFAASFIGVSNLLDGEVIALSDGVAEVATDAGLSLRALTRPDQRVRVGSRVILSLRPEDFEPCDENLSPVNLIEGRVHRTAYLGNKGEATIQVNSVKLRVDTRPGAVMAQDGHVALTITPENVVLVVDHPSDAESRLPAGLQALPV